MNAARDLLPHDSSLLMILPSAFDSAETAVTTARAAARGCCPPHRELPLLLAYFARASTSSSSSDPKPHWQLEHDPHSRLEGRCLPIRRRHLLERVALSRRKSRLHDLRQRFTSGGRFDREISLSFGDKDLLDLRVILASRSPRSDHHSSVPRNRHTSRPASSNF